MKKIAIIGANEYQNKLVIKANNMGLETHVFAWPEGAIAKENADYFYPISITDKKQILSKLIEIKPDGVCSIGSDLAVPTVNYLAYNLGLIGNSLNCTKLTTDKYKMRQALLESKIPIPAFQLIKDFNELDIDSLHFPLIIKPRDRSGSRGINKVHTIEELQSAIKSAKNITFTDSILIEDYIEGDEYSVEFISQNGEHFFIQITEKYTSGAPNFIEKAHFAPAKLDINTIANVRKIIYNSLVALGIKNGASHSEIKISPSGEIIVIEVASRMGGDFIGSDLVIQSTGFDYTESVIDIALNNSIYIPEKFESNNSLINFIFDEDDVLKFEKIKMKFPTSIIEASLNEDIENVKDSSSRNGYYIMSLIEDEKLAKVK